MRYLISIAIIFIFFRCEKSSTPLDQEPNDSQKLELNCDNLQEGIIYLNTQIVTTEINKLTVDLEPKVNQNDEFGHRENLNILINRLNSNCDSINFELICYACIKTLPLQSEILVSIDSVGTIVKRVVDILTPNTNVLNCIRIHISTSSQPTILEIPDCIDELIIKFQNEPVGSPPQSIWQYEYNGDTVYYVPAQCCDQLSILYDSECNIICAPDGGFSGHGDGRCPDFFANRTSEKLVWKDPRYR